MKRENRTLFITNGLRDESIAIKQSLEYFKDTIGSFSMMATTPEIPGEIASYAEELNKALVQKLESYYEKATSVDPRNNPDFETKVLHSKHIFVDVILFMLKNDMELLIKQAEPTSNDAGFASLDMSLLRKCPAPVCLLRPPSAAKPAKRIIAVAIDPEFDEECAYELSKNLLQYASVISKSVGATLEIIACWDSFLDKVEGNVFIKVSKEDVGTEYEEKKRQHKNVLERLINEAPINCEYKIVQLKGKPEEIIPEYVNRHSIELLVMGTVARTGIPGFIIGNTAENMLNDLNASVLALKPPGFVSPVKSN